MTTHRGIREDPPGSNTDRRVDGIRAAQIRLGNGDTYLVGRPWCGVWVGAGLQAAGVERVDGRIASVYWIEMQAKGGNPPFTGWTTDVSKARRGDLVVFHFGEGRGVHVGMFRMRISGGRIVTDEGNTSSGNAGSQSNGGGSYRRIRRVRDVWGVALVDYPDR